MLENVSLGAQLYLRSSQMTDCWKIFRIPEGNEMVGLNENSNTMSFINPTGHITKLGYYAF